MNNNAKKGSEWQADKVYQISVLNFHFKKGDKSEMSWYTMKDGKGNGLADKLNVIFIDLLTIKKLVGTPVESLTPLQKWGLFFSYADDESKTEYVSQIAESEEGIMEADRIAQRMSEEDANWFRQNSIDIARRDRNAEIGAAKEKVALQKAVETAQNLLAMNVLTPEQIAQAIGLPLEQVLELQKELAAAPAN